MVSTRIAIPVCFVSAAPAGALAIATKGLSMPASLAEIEIEGGISALKCPITGIDLIVEEEGFNETAAHSPYLRFFVDWIGQIWVANPDDLSSEQSRNQREIIEIFARKDNEVTQNETIEEVRQILPKSAVILEILDPPQGSFSGEICYACFDLGNAALTSRIQLQSVD